MPKCYSQQERDCIRRRLQEEAGKCLSQYGVRRTTVDELVHRVRIPKGTFYLFYPSKEMLLFEVILKQHDMIEQQLCTAIGDIDPNLSLETQLTDILFDLYQQASISPILRMLSSGEVELLARKLPPEVLADHLGHDTDMIEMMMNKLPIKSDVDMQAIGSAFRAIYFASLHSDELPDDSYLQGLRVLIYGVVLQMV